MSHVGLCVADLDRSLRFYTEGLGFDVVASFTFGDEVAGTAEMPPGLEGGSTMIDKDGARIELLWYAKPGVQGTPSKVRNQLGLTHLCLEVDSIAETAARLVALGATVLESTRTHLGSGAAAIDLLVLTDPDGNRIELLERGSVG
jgi:catechol 2,3-dioxygenase-like lactoylglutathione lyase family enzyme